MVLTVFVSRAYLGEEADWLTLDHVLVQFESLLVCCICPHALIDDLSILVQASVCRYGAFVLGRAEELECVCEFTVQCTREENSVCC